MREYITNNSSYHKHQRNAGFTLVELLVTIAIVAIIVGFAAPNMMTQLANQRVKATTMKLTNVLNQAKSESVIRRQSLTVKYDNTSNPRVITINGQGADVIASYTYNSKVTIESDPAILKFESGKRADAAITYTLCDGVRTAMVRQVTVNKIANINTRTGGACS